MLSDKTKVNVISLPDYEKHGLRHLSESIEDSVKSLFGNLLHVFDVFLTQTSWKVDNVQIQRALKQYFRQFVVILIIWTDKLPVHILKGCI